MQNTRFAALLVIALLARGAFSSDIPSVTVSGNREVYFKIDGDNAHDPLHLEFIDEQGKTTKLVHFDPWGSKPNESDQLQYQIIRILGIQGPVIEVTALDPGGSDGRLETTLIAFKNGKPIDLLFPHIETNYEDAVCTGTYGAKGEPGVLVIHFLWGDEAHFEPHRYQVQLYLLHHDRFVESHKSETKQKYGNWNKAAMEFGYDCKHEITHELYKEL